MAWCGLVMMSNITKEELKHYFDDVNYILQSYAENNGQRWFHDARHDGDLASVIMDNTDVGREAAFLIAKRAFAEYEVNAGIDYDDFVSAMEEGEAEYE